MLYLFLTLLFEINSNASEYQPLKDQNWQACTASAFVVAYKQAEFTVNYQICSQDSDIPSKEELIATTQKIFDFAAVSGLEPINKNCATTFTLNKLEFYKISVAILNDKNRFPQWLNQGSPIWGLYDPRPTEKVVASIMLTEQGDFWDKIILAHELSHFWYDKLCWNRAWTKGDEQFALDIEKYLSK